MRFLPAGIGGHVAAVLALALAVIYAMAIQGGSGLAEGARFGALIGIFAVGAFVMHNYVNLNIGLKLTLQQGVSLFRRMGCHGYSDWPYLSPAR